MSRVRVFFVGAVLMLFAVALLSSPVLVSAKKKQAKAKGPITAVDLVGSTVTIHDVKSDADVIVTLDENTSIHKDNNEHASLEDLAVGDNAKARYNKDTFLASRVHAKSPRVKGEIIEKDTDAQSVTIQPAEGDPVTVFVTPDTKLRRNDEQATFDDLAVGDQAKAWYDAATFDASKLIATSPEESEE